jgi:hypothetical protein
MLPGDRQEVERREVSRLAPPFYIELRPDAPDEFRPEALGGKHPAQKEQIARLHRFHVGAERLGRRRELNAKFFQALLGADRPRTCVAASTAVWAARCAGFQGALYLLESHCRFLF